MAAVGLAIVAMDGFVATLPGASSSGNRVGLTLVAACTAAAGVWFAAAGLRTRAILSELGLDYRSAFRSRTLQLADILGWRRTPGRQRGIQVDLRPGRGRPLAMTGDLKRDAAWDAWFARLPNLDDIERAASRARVLDDKTLGATPHDVAPKLDRVILLARIATIASLAVAVGVQFGPIVWDGHAIVAAALCIALLALLAAFLLPGLVTLNLNKQANDVRPSMIAVVALPVMMLGLSLWTQANLMDLERLVVPALAGGALGLMLAVRREPTLRQRGWDALAVLVWIGAYAGVATGWLDILADTSPARPVQVVITGNFVAKGTLWRVHLGPAPTARDWTSLNVSGIALRGLQISDVACLGEHLGLFGLRWAEVRPCGAAAGRTPADAARHRLAHAARPATQRPPLAQTLVDGDWQRVDATLNDLQRRFEAGEVSDVDVEQAYVPLYNVEPALDAPLANWLEHAPKSYAAHLAMALHTERQIEWLKGGGFSARRSPELNWEERTAFALAQVEASIVLSRRPALSLMAQYRLEPQSWKQASDWLDHLVDVDPQDLVMRREYLIQHPLCPCHGQAPEDPAMRRALQQPASQRVRDALAAYRLFERGADAGVTPQAVQLYQQALALRPYPQDAYTSHINIAVALIEGKRLDEAIVELKAAIATLPGNRHAHEELGYVYELQNRMPEALAEFLVDAERGQSWAQMRVGSFLLTPERGVPQDRRRGAYWMREAANAGEPRAREILRAHPELMVEYPPTY